MNNEIKEKIKAYYIGNDIEQLLDYITKLQLENKRLKEKGSDVMYIILQLCCFDCNKFIGLYLCHDKDYVTFIKNLEVFDDYCYIVYDTNLNEIIRLDY